MVRIRLYDLLKYLKRVISQFLKLNEFCSANKNYRQIEVKPMKFKLVNVLKFTQKRSTNHLRQFCLFGLLLLCTQLIYADERGGQLFGKVM